jgi:hypothetical protein
MSSGRWTVWTETIKMKKDNWHGTISFTPEALGRVSQNLWP